MKSQVFDFIGIGLGPFNLGLACLSQPLSQLNAIFLEKKPQFGWHTGMLLPGSTLQTPFLSDLVTMADPTSPFSFLNYLKQNNRLYQFYILENFNPSRIEYNDYCNWAVKKLNNIIFEETVEEIDFLEDEKIYRIKSRNAQNDTDTIYYTKRLVLGSGTQPFIPDHCQDLAQQACHTAQYLEQKPRLQQASSITVIGSGQSAAEVFYDLLCDIERFPYHINWITRSSRFFPLDYSKLTLEMTSPDYVDYFYGLPIKKRADLLDQQKPLFKGINLSLLEQIYQKLYALNLSETPRVTMMTNAELVSGHYHHDQKLYDLSLHQKEQDRHIGIKTEALIFGTGYGYKEPEFLKPIKTRIAYLDNGQHDVSRHYTIDKNHNEIYVQNAELHSHGFAAPDLGMGCYRNSKILAHICGHKIYKTEDRIAFQNFDPAAVL